MKSSSVDFPALDVTALIEYCKSLAPNEAGGYIDGQGRFRPLVNKHPNPPMGFYFPDLPMDAKAVIHSHPGGPFAPSEDDQRQQLAMSIPWGIVAWSDKREAELFWFGDELEPPPLIGRGFRHAVTDCWGAMRHAYLYEAEIELPAILHEWNWWKAGEDRFAFHLTAMGFQEVPWRVVRPGDLILMTVRASVPNHSAVWLGDGLIYHHMSSRTEYEPGALSTVEPAGRWFPFFAKVMRYEDGRIVRTFGEKIRALV